MTVRRHLRAARADRARLAASYFGVVRVAFRKTAMSATDVGMNGGNVLAGLLELVEMVALDGLVGELFVMP